MKLSIRQAAGAATAAIAACLVAGSGLASAASDLPPVHRAGAVSYLSGGIGQNESMAFERAARDWPLSLEFAVKDGQRADFAAGVDIVIRDAAGRAALQARAEGPFLLARLGPGAYDVAATLQGRTMHQKVVVKAGASARAIFLWPTGTAGVHPQS
jgi:hypothetical protein